MGIRGIPANYGGFETFAEEISTRLVQKGHDVTVYGRSNNIQYRNAVYKGVQLVILPTWGHKYFDTVVHTCLSVFHGLSRKYDVVLICNSVNTIFSCIPRLTRAKVIVNVDGLEWQRAKWNKIGQLVYKTSEYLTKFLPTAIVSDSLFVKDYYLEHYKKESTFIPYGCPTKSVDSKHVLDQFNLKKEDYFLYVSRLEPENNAHIVVRAFENVKSNKKLVIVGDAPYNQKYIDELHATKDKRIIFTGYQFGQSYQEFQSHAYCYIQATEVGGTHPALLEGMGFGNCVLANDVPEHREVVQDAGIYFKTDPLSDLTEKIQYLNDHPDIVKEYRKKAANHVRQNYSWDKITDDYELLFESLL